jgi:fructose-1-phosphate kinase PfkB-like protein
MVITVILDAALEKTLHIPGLALGASCRAERSCLQPGGQGLTAAAALHSLGGQCAAVGIVGGAEGEYIRDRLDLMGLPNDLVLGRAQTPTNLCLADGDRWTHIREAAAAATDQELLEVWQKVSDLAKPGDSVLLAGELPPAMTPELLAQWVGQLRREGVLVALNLEPAQRYAAAKPSLLITGPAGKWISIVAMALCGVIFIMNKDDISGGFKLLLSVIFGISFIAFAGSIVNSVFSFSGAVI